MSATEQAEAEAARWLAARDAGEGRADHEAFERWLDADIRHRVAYLRLEASWKRADRLAELRPLDRGLDPDLLKAPGTSRPWRYALAASVVLALIVAGGWFYRVHFSWHRYDTPVGGFARIVLEDGSVVDLNTNSEIRVRLGSARRDIKLARGEVRFQVAHDPSRPFVVAAAGAAVRAVGTQFTVRLRDSARVDVLVSEGKVAVASAHVQTAPAVTAGEVAVLEPDHVSVSKVEPQLMARRLAWTSGHLEFRGETLGLAVDEFNRYNRRQLRLADAKLANLRVGGTFSATDPDSFAAALASAFHVRVAPQGLDAIVLQPP